MKRGFLLELRGRRRIAAARGMARLGFPAAIIAVVLGLKRATAQAIVEAKAAPDALWSAAQRALFRGEGL